MNTKKRKIPTVMLAGLLVLNAALFVAFVDETYRLVAEVSLFNQQYDPSWGMPAVAMASVAALSVMAAFRYRRESPKVAVALGGLASFVAAGLAMEAVMDYRLVPFGFWSLLIAVPPMACVLVVGFIVPSNSGRAD